MTLHHGKHGVELIAFWNVRRHRTCNKLFRFHSSENDFILQDMDKNWVLTFESWPLCTDIPLVAEGGKLTCKWSHGRYTINAELAPAPTPVMSIRATKNDSLILNTEAKGTACADGWVFQAKLEGKKHSKDEFDRSQVRVTVTPDAFLRGLFANAPFGLSYMPIMRHFIERSLPKAILEWGPGRSTLMLAESLPETAIFSIEHHPDWHERIVRLAGRYPQVVPIHEPLTLKPGKSGKYVTAPLYLDRKFDLIFIDGRMRTDCIAIARQVMSENGAVLVHDANRISYHQAFYFFEQVSIINDTAVLRSPLA